MDVVDVLGHLARGLAEPHPLDERLDERCGLRPHDVRADDEPRASVDEHLREGRLIDERPPVGGAAEVAATDDVIDALGAGLLLGEPDGGHLGVAEHRAGHRAELDPAEVLGVGDVPERDLGLGVGEVLQPDVVGDVADGPDVGHRGPLELVDDDGPVVVEFHPRPVSLEEIAVGFAAGGHQQLVDDDLATVAVHDDAVGSTLDEGGEVVEVEVDPLGEHRGESLGDLSVVG